MKYSRDLKLLKFFVYLMGVVIIFATMFLTYTIYNKHFEVHNQHADTQKISCKADRFVADRKIISISLDGTKIGLLTELKEGVQKLYIIDSCTHETISEMEIDAKETVSYPKTFEDIENQIIS